MKSSINDNNISEKKVYIVFLKKYRKKYFIDRNNLILKIGDYVVVQAEKGIDIGRIAYQVMENMMPKDNRRYPLEILRKADDRDLRQLGENRAEEAEALEICQDFIDFRGLDMKLLYAEYQFDRSKLTFYFTAEQRIDFRELVKDLAAYYRTRIQLRQIGVRDEAKRRPALGPCGLQTCCSKFIDDFESIPTKYARDQKLSVNPEKISGLCGRLMCCLAFEEDFYSESSKEYPQMSDTIKLKGKKFSVVDVNLLTQMITLLEDTESEERETKQLSLSEYKKKRGSNKEFLKKWKR